MTLKEKISKDYITAYKAKDTQKVDVLRMIQSAIKNIEIASKKEAEDKEVLDVLAKQAKQRKDAIAQYTSGSRNDLAQKEKHELDIISSYLPEQLSEEDVKDIVKQVIQQTKSQTKADMGKVMAAVMPKIKGKADGSLVSKIVSDSLQ